MPIEVTLAKSPGGVVFVRGSAHGVVTAADAHVLMDPLWAGGEHHEKALLAMVAADTDFSKDARGVLGHKDEERNARGTPMALVVAGAPLRVMMSFIFRMAGVTARSKVFATEAEATAWLFSKLDH